MATLSNIVLLWIKSLLWIYVKTYFKHQKLQRFPEKRVRKPLNYEINGIYMPDYRPQRNWFHQSAVLHSFKSNFRVFKLFYHIPKNKLWRLKHHPKAHINHCVSKSIIIHNYLRKWAHTLNTSTQEPRQSSLSSGQPGLCS